MRNREVRKGFRQKDSGFITAIIILIIALVLLKYFFDWSVFEARETPQGQETEGYARKLIETIWLYIKAPIVWIVENIVRPIFGVVWGYFQDFISWSNQKRS